MATLRQLKTIAKSVGATVEDARSGSHHLCRVEAPHRKHWIEGGVHELVDETNRPWKPDYQDLIERMMHGLDDCIGYCEWCDGE